jgi:hypothetical protein
MASAMTPILSQYWDQGGKAVRERIGLDPDQWQVTDPNLKAKIETASLAFCQTTNQTTSLKLDVALAKLRAELVAGLVDAGDSIPQLTKRVQSVFDQATKSRARMIAATEAARAVHAAQEQSAIDSGVVVGMEWLVSGDACPLCLQIAAEVRAVPLGTRFAEVGNNPSYKDVRHPPAHPHCQCSIVEVLRPEFGGPADPKWGTPLIQPDPPDDYKPPGGKLPVPEPAKLEPKPAAKPKPKPAPKPKPKPVAPPPPPPAPAPPPPPPPKPAPVRAFPDDPEADVEVVKQLGGSTGAELVRDKATGKQFVRKRGNNPGHLLEEAHADAIYRAAGADVPASRVYQTAAGPVKLAEFVEGETLGAWKASRFSDAQKPTFDRVAEHFALDALLGNWDVVGQGYDNILVTPDGRVLRIDNGGSLRYRAQGATKSGSQWSGVVAELATLRDPKVNRQTADVFKYLTEDDVRNQVAALAKKRQAILDAAPPELREMLGKRLDWMAEWAKPRPEPAHPAGWAPRPATEFKDLRGDDGHAWGKARYDAWVDSLTPEETRAVKYYTSSGYKALNRYHRTGQAADPAEEAEFKAITAHLDAALEKGRLKEGVVVFRGTNLRDALGLDPDKLKPGDIIPDPAYTSTAVKPEKAWSGTEMEIRVPAGTPAAYVDAGRSGPISSVAGERELILGRSASELRVVGWEKRGSRKTGFRRWLVLEVVNRP